MRGLFAQCCAAPREVDALHDGFAVRCEAEFGGAAAQGVVRVAPLGAVGAGDLREAVFRVPLVVPGVGFAGQAGLLAQGDAAEGVVFVADVARVGDPGAGVGVGARGLVAGVLGGPGCVCLVAGVVVGVGLGPVVGVDGGDAAGRVDVEVARAVELIVDAGQIAVGAVGVGPVL